MLAFCAVKDNFLAAEKCWDIPPFTSEIMSLLAGSTT